MQTNQFVPDRCETKRGVHGISVLCTKFRRGSFEITRKKKMKQENRFKKTDIESSRSEDLPSDEISNFQMFKGRKSETTIPRYIGVSLLSKI